MEDHDEFLVRRAPSINLAQGKPSFASSTDDAMVVRLRRPTIDIRRPRFNSVDYKRRTSVGYCVRTHVSDSNLQ
jgi:hypothetical protein